MILMAFNVAVAEKVEEPLLSRTVLKGVVAYDTAPPSFAELRKHLAQHLKADEAVVVISRCVPVFGSRKSSLEAYVYKTKQDAGMFSSKVILARNQPRVKKAPTAAATAAAEKK
ncbi:hypothetical protein HYU16_02780 [Candidatus Woesearchaeota archaeon]|nr:hypothetical protein [Candidatus Woesearchaeota archaeon]